MIGNDVVRLTGRQQEILQMMAAGLTYREMAAKLGVAPKTIRNLRAELYERLEVSTAGKAVAIGFRQGLLS